MNNIKEQIIKLLQKSSDTVYGRGSCGELGDSFNALDSDCFSDIATEIYEKLIKDLQHHKDTTVGLFATDKEIGDLLYIFWQRSSDACPLECTQAEEQENAFKEWVKNISWQIT